MPNPYDEFFDQEVDDADVVACYQCGEEDLFRVPGTRNLVDEDGNKHICDHAEGFGEVTDDTN